VDDVYGIRFPPSTSKVIDSLAFLNLDLSSFGASTLGCLNLDSYEKRLLVTTISPAVLMAVIPLVMPLVGPSHARPTARATRTSRAEVTRWALWRYLLRALPVALLVSFFAFPAVSNLAFRAFDCQCFEKADAEGLGFLGDSAVEGVSYLVADWRVVCGSCSRGNQRQPTIVSPEYARIKTLAHVAIVCYPAGVPLAILALLLHGRSRLLKMPRKREERLLKLDEYSRALDMLHAKYKPEFYWWELVRVLEMVVVVGFMSTGLGLGIDRGTVRQALVGIVVVLLHICATVIADPFIQRFAMVQDVILSALLVAVLLNVVRIHLGSLAADPTVWKELERANLRYRSPAAVVGVVRGQLSCCGGAPQGGDREHRIAERRLCWPADPGLPKSAGWTSTIRRTREKSPPMRRTSTPCWR
jgi:hypothetical protein